MTESRAIGTLWTDYEDDESQAHFEARVTRFVMRASEISLEFSGHDSDDGRYSGWCKLVRNGDQWVGAGEFFFAPKNRVPAKVTATLTSDGEHYFLSGDWLDQGDQQSADLGVEILKEAIH